MNTFIISSDIRETARVLDRQRLGKQRLETLQLLNVCSKMQIVQSRGIDLTDWNQVPLRPLSNEERLLVKKRRQSLKEKKRKLKLKGWINHPARLCWIGHEKALAHYGILICKEWASRGYEDNLAKSIANIASNFPLSKYPDWIYDPQVHLLMKQSLRYKEIEDNAKLVSEKKEPVWRYRNKWPEISPIYGYHWSKPEDVRHLHCSEDEAILSTDWVREKK